MRYEVKKDRYTKVRGEPRFYILSCSKCGKEIFIYQKDGSGNLLRLYLDRFVAPISFAEGLKAFSSKKDMPPLKCPHCGELLGVPMVYEKENRLAYRLIKGKLQKRESPSPLDYDL